MSAGLSASGSMPAWLISASRRGEPDASTNLGRPIMGGALTNKASDGRCEARKLAEGQSYHNTWRVLPLPALLAFLLSSLGTSSPLPLGKRGRHQEAVAPP